MAIKKMKRQTLGRAYFANYRKLKFVPWARAWGGITKYCQKEQEVFWVQVYAGKNSQNVKMEQIVAGRVWDVNNDMMKAYK